LFRNYLLGIIVAGGLLVIGGVLDDKFNFAAATTDNFSDPGKFGDCHLRIGIKSY
jgi:hypothetical protein